MNERILTLAKQAEITHGVWAVPDFILERFAELIIWECHKASTNFIKDMNYQVSSVPIQVFLEHFQFEVSKVNK